MKTPSRRPRLRHVLSDTVSMIKAVFKKRTRRKFTGLRLQIK